MVAGYLYVVSKDDGAGPCKVGITRDPAKRLKGLQTAAPYKLVFAELWDFEDPGYPRFAEDMAHAALKSFRMHGEWFQVEPSEAIARITIWMLWAARASAQDAGEDPASVELPPPQGVGLIANGLADHTGALLA